MCYGRLSRADRQSRLEENHYNKDDIDSPGVIFMLSEEDIKDFGLSTGQTLLLKKWVKELSTNPEETSSQSSNAEGGQHRNNKSGIVRIAGRRINGVISEYSLFQNYLNQAENSWDQTKGKDLKKDPPLLIREQISKV